MGLPKLWHLLWKMFFIDNGTINQEFGFMIRIVYFEIRKNYLRSYVVIALLSFLLINILIIYKDYLYGPNDLYGYFCRILRNIRNGGSLIRKCMIKCREN